MMGYDSDDDEALSLTQLMAPPRGAAPPPHFDSIPDSCSEEESDDDAAPLPLPLPPPAAGPSRAGTARKEVIQATTSSAGPSRAGGIRTVMGNGGRVVYHVASGEKECHYYVVQWRKPQMKKHKTWDGDAYLKVEGNKITMVDDTGKHMASGSLAGDGLPKDGQEFRLGNYETEVDRQLTPEEFKSITSILGKGSASIVPSYMSPLLHRSSSVSVSGGHTSRSFKPPTMTHKPKETGTTYLPRQDENGHSVVGPSYLGGQPVRTGTGSGSPGSGPVVKPSKTIPAASFYGAPKPSSGSGNGVVHSHKAGEKIVIGEKSNKERKEWGGAMHNPHAEGAVVMQRPPEKWAAERKTQIVDVVLDPDLAAVMREHQKEGVKFMYSCVMGLNSTNGEGCILADEMGLGKTLQTVALLHTLFRQSPYQSQTAFIGKAMVVCPVTLVDNWKREFRKWVNGRIGVVVADGSDHQIGTFCHNKTQNVLIIGYERLRKVVKQLASCQPPIDLIICDEGHRLKSKDNKTTKMFEELRTRRRIILSGTPLQNDLSEYWAMANFVNPGVLGKYSEFNRIYEKAIYKSRAPGCPKADLFKGQERAEELGEISRTFVLRRTAAVLDHYLPPKHEYVLFVAPSKLQLDIFRKLLSPSILANFLRNRVQPLGFIDVLRKVCNSPMLLKRKAEKDDISLAAEDSEDVGTALQQALAAIPKGIDPADTGTSGKMTLLHRMLQHLHSDTTEKVVVVSNWTTTLDLVQDLLKTLRLPYLRLDGSTAQKNRQGLVDQFNKGRREDSFVFLLSAKAGGTGLNLIGASRLILFDSDWNPSTDLQAMARIHRDGQKRPVFIYRLLTTSTIDEKIYQRQVTKTGLSDQMLDRAQNEKSSNSFSDAELRDLFTLQLTTNGCQTHDLLGCDCTNPDRKPDPSSSMGGGKDDPSEDEGSDSESGSGKANFVPASSYSAEPTSKMLKKAAQEKKDKLASLKRWTHFDGFERSSFDGINDPLLHSILWADMDKTVRTPAGILEEADDEFAGIEDIPLDNAIVEPASSGHGKVKGDKTTVNLNDLFDSPEFDLATDPPPSPSHSTSTSSSTSASAGGGRVKRKAAVVAQAIIDKKKQKRKEGRGVKLGSSLVGEEQGRKYHLAEVVGGRVMFMFEKVSKSKM